MAVEVILPKVDMDMETGRISRWYAKDGDLVTKGQLLFEIETDKAAMEVDAPASGMLSGVVAAEGAVVPVGQAVAWIYSEGEAVQPKERPESVSTPEASLSAVTESESQLAIQRSDVSTTDLAQHRATPLARRLAREAGLGLDGIQGSGPNGRIQRKDIEKSLGSMGSKLSPIIQNAEGSNPLHSLWLRDGDRSLLPIVMLHGFASDLNSWRALVQVGSVRNPILGIDLPCHGQSSNRSIDRIDDLVTAVEMTMHRLGIGECIVVGHSLGGAVAALLASRGKITVRSLMLISSGGLGPQVNGAFLRGISSAKSEASLMPWLRLLVADKMHMTTGFVRAAVAQSANVNQREAQFTMAGRLFADDTQCFDIRGCLEDLAMPVRLIFGANDQVIPVEHVRGVPGKIAVHIFSNCGHMPQIEERDAIAALLHEVSASVANAI